LDHHHHSFSMSNAIIQQFYYSVGTFDLWTESKFNPQSHNFTFSNNFISHHTTLSPL
jgi:hypothetical protein